MFWRTGRKRDVEAEKAREREAFLRRLREVLEPHCVDFESAKSSSERCSGGDTRGLPVDAGSLRESHPLSPSSLWYDPVVDSRH